MSPSPRLRPKRPTTVPPGQVVTVRTHRDLRTLLSRVHEGDLVVIDRRDLDAETARSLAEKKPYAVLNAAEFISGRFANLGPAVLAENGILLLEAERTAALALRDGTVLRLDDGTLYDGAVATVDVRALSADQITLRMEQARAGLAAQLDSFAHTTSEFLRREEAVVLHGTGLPTLRAAIEGRPVVVVGPGAQVKDLKRLRRFIRQQKPVLIGVDAGAELLVQRRLRPDVAVLTGIGEIGKKALGRSREVVLTGSGDAARRQLEKLNLPVHPVHSSMAGTDLALLIAFRAGARLLVPVGSPATLEDFIDRRRSDQASVMMTRLQVGAVLVEAEALPHVYTGRVRPWQVGIVLLASLAVLAVAVALTPIGNTWWDDLLRDLPVGVGR